MLDGILRLLLASRQSRSNFAVSYKKLCVFKVFMALGIWEDGCGR